MMGMLLSGCISSNGETEVPDTTLAPTQPPTTQPPAGVKTPVQIGAIQWEYYDNAIEASQEEDKHIFFYFWRDNCPFCDQMKDSTLVDPEVAVYLLENFSSVEVNIWSDEAMSAISSNVTGVSLNSTFKLIGAPSIGFVNSKGEIVYIVPGYKDTTEFMLILEYVNSVSYVDMTFSEFVKEQQ